MLRQSTLASTHPLGIVTALSSARAAVPRTDTGEMIAAFEILRRRWRIAICAGSGPPIRPAVAHTLHRDRTARGGCGRIRARRDLRSDITARSADRIAGARHFIAVVGDLPRHRVGIVRMATEQSDRVLSGAKASLALRRPSALSTHRGATAAPPNAEKSCWLARSNENHRVRFVASARCDKITPIAASANDMKKDIHGCGALRLCFCPCGRFGADRRRRCVKAAQARRCAHNDPRAGCRQVGWAKVGERHAAGLQMQAAGVCGRRNCHHRIFEKSDPAPRSGGAGEAGEDRPAQEPPRRRRRARGSRRR